MIPINITIKDVAKELGVSYSSISRALNGKEGVSEITRKKILEKAEEMGYQPNDLARGLVNKISNAVGVIIPDINNPFFGEIVAGISDAAREKEYNLFLCMSGWSPEDERLNVDALKKKRVDGIILKPLRDDGSYGDVRSPLMIMEGYSQGENHHSVEVNNEQGGYLAVKHLLDCGYRKIGIILGKEDLFACNQRLKGAERAMKEYGLSLDKHLTVEGSFSIEGGRQAAQELFERSNDIDAVFGMNDQIGLGVLQHCSDSQIRVPEDVGVVGFDNISYSRLPQIQLTTVHQPKYELGRMAFENLWETIQAKEESIPVRKVILEPELLVRKTTCIHKTLEK